ncbi:hypothetical protein NDU88_001685 [Pleurodeles waltl]|uniref:Uncharacterized protein n=1 Tax=Pleurodeles waltl TaxID=8319 RepID=A0AAV7Q4E1_PLEWA|nr:hypothetical protein NDU88_001685 [Pleurodeles waltl]
MGSRAHGRVFVPRGGSPSQEEEGSSEEGEVVGQQLGESQGIERGLFPGTPDLFELGPLDFDGDDSGEHGAALLPWEEEKGSPRAANRMTSKGRRGRRGRAADAFSRLCGGVGDTPPGTAAWEEQRLGSIKTWGYDSDYAGGARGCALARVALMGRGKMVVQGFIIFQRTLVRKQIPYSGSMTKMPVGVFLPDIQLFYAHLAERAITHSLEKGRTWSFTNSGNLLLHLKLHLRMNDHPTDVQLQTSWRWARVLPGGAPTCCGGSREVPGRCPGSVGGKVGASSVVNNIPRPGPARSLPHTSLLPC